MGMTSSRWGCGDSRLIPHAHFEASPPPIYSQLRFAMRVTPTDARLASSRWSDDPGRAFHPKGSYGSVPCIASRPPSASFAWRKPGRRRGCPRRLPQIRTCPIKASGSSRRGLTCAALPVVVSWTADRGSMPPRCCPATAPRRGAPFPPPGARGTSSPASAVLWSAPIPGRPYRPTSLPSRDGYHPVRLCSSLHTSPTPAWGQGCSGQATPRACRYRGRDGRASQVPGEPQVSVCPVQSTPAGLLSPDRYSAAAWPLVCEKQRLPRKVFPRSIEGRSDSLSTLRRLGYPSRRKTRFQPLVRRYWTGFDPQGSYETFPRRNRYIPSSFPKLYLAQSHRPRHPPAFAVP